GRRSPLRALCLSETTSKARQQKGEAARNSFAVATIPPYHVPNWCTGSCPRRLLPAAGWGPAHHLSSPNPQQHYVRAQSPRAVRGLVGRSISAATVRWVVAVPRYRWRPPAPAARRLLIRGRSGRARHGAWLSAAPRRGAPRRPGPTSEVHLPRSTIRLVGVSW